MCTTALWQILAMFREFSQHYGVSLFWAVIASCGFIHMVHMYRTVPDLDKNELNYLIRRVFPFLYVENDFKLVDNGKLTYKGRLIRNLIRVFTGYYEDSDKFFKAILLNMLIGVFGVSMTVASMPPKEHYDGIVSIFCSFWAVYVFSCIYASYKWRKSNREMDNKLLEQFKDMPAGVDLVNIIHEIMGKSEQNEVFWIKTIERATEPVITKLIDDKLSRSLNQIKDRLTTIESKIGANGNTSGNK